MQLVQDIFHAHRGEKELMCQKSIEIYIKTKLFSPIVIGKVGV